MDELMSDPAQPFAASQDGDNSHKPAGWNTKKFREEYDAAKARLTDQRFDITQYADPLMPRGPNVIHGSAASHSSSLETEKRLQDMIAEIKASGAPTA